MLHYPEPTVVR